MTHTYQKTFEVYCFFATIHIFNPGKNIARSNADLKKYSRKKRKRT